MANGQQNTPQKVEAQNAPPKVEAPKAFTINVLETDPAKKLEEEKESIMAKNREERMALMKEIKLNTQPS